MKYLPSLVAFLFIACTTKHSNEEHTGVTSTQTGTQISEVVNGVELVSTETLPNCLDSIELYYLPNTDDSYLCLENEAFKLPNLNKKVFGETVTIQWLGYLPEEPSEPQNNDLFYHTTPEQLKIYVDQWEVVWSKEGSTPIAQSSDSIPQDSLPSSEEEKDPEPQEPENPDSIPQQQNSDNIDQNEKHLMKLVPENVDLEIPELLWDSTEVTQGEYSNLMGESPWATPLKNEVSSFAIAPNRPAVYINFYQMVLMANERSKSHGFDTVYTYTTLTAENGVDLRVNYSANGYRLPTQKEFDHAHAPQGTGFSSYWNDLAWAVEEYPRNAADSSEVSKYAI